MSERTPRISSRIPLRSLTSLGAVASLWVSRLYAFSIENTVKAMAKTLTIAVRARPEADPRGVPFDRSGSWRRAKFGLPNRIPTIGMIMLSTREVTAAVTATPITNPTAMPSRSPLLMNSLNSAMNAFLRVSYTSVRVRSGRQAMGRVARVPAPQAGTYPARLPISA